MLKLYTLDAAGNPVPEKDVLAWGEWYGKSDRSLKTTTQEGIAIATYFLGVDHNPFPAGSPQLYETQVGTSGSVQTVRRYATKDEALAGHDATVQELQSATAWRDGKEEQN